MKWKPPHPAKLLGCTKQQIAAFEQIAINNDRQVSVRMMQTLAKKGLVELAEEILPGFPPVKILRASVPQPIHYEWCLWCSAQPAPTGEAQSSE